MDGWRQVAVPSRGRSRTNAQQPGSRPGRPPSHPQVAGRTVRHRPTEAYRPRVCRPCRCRVPCATVVAGDLRPPGGEKHDDRAVPQVRAALPDAERAALAPARGSPPDHRAGPAGPAAWADPPARSGDHPERNTPYKELVRLLTSRRVSAVPVVDNRGRVLGVVSEADLLRKQEQPARPFARLPSARRRRRERAKAEATVAAELMTRPAVTVDPLATVTEAARRMHRAGVKRLPVVDVVGRLVGIVSRVDLLKGFLRPDEELRREIVEDVIFGDLVMAPNRFDVD